MSTSFPILNQKTVTEELANESTIGTRSVVAGQVVIPIPSPRWPVGTKIYTVDTKSMWNVVENPLGTYLAVLTYEYSQFSVTTLPPPRVRVRTSVVQKGQTRTGNSTFGYGLITVSLEDVPNIFLTDAAYSFQLELLRYVPKRRKLTEVAPSSFGYVSQPAGFYHPSNWVDGVTPNGVAGTRGGSQNVSVNRPTEWSLSGLSQNQKIEIYASQVMLPYFEIYRIEDFSGATVDTLVYWLGQKRKDPRGVISYGRSPFTGIFAFRYAVYDATQGRMVSGPHSIPIYARPQKWPTVIDPGSTFNKKRIVNTNSVVDPNTGRSCYEQLSISVGGRIVGRQF